MLNIIASGQAGFGVSTGFAYGYGEHLSGGNSPLSELVHEVVITVMFLLIIPGPTSKLRPKTCAIASSRPWTPQDSQLRWRNDVRRGMRGSHDRRGRPQKKQGPRTGALR